MRRFTETKRPTTTPHAARALGALAAIALAGAHAGAAPTAEAPGSSVMTFDSGGQLNPGNNGGFVLGGLEVDPANGRVFALAHDVPVWSVSGQARLLVSVGPGTAAPDASGPFPLTQQTRATDLTHHDGVYYVAAINNGNPGIFGIEPGNGALQTFAAGPSIPRWATSGLTFDDGGGSARVTSDFEIGHHRVDQGDTSSTALAGQMPLPSGYGDAASDHVVTRDGRTIVAGEVSRMLFDVSQGSGNVEMFFDLTTVPGYADAGAGIFGSRAALDPVSGDIFVAYAVNGSQIYRIARDGSVGQLFASGFVGGVRDLAFGQASDGSGAVSLFAAEVAGGTTGSIYEFFVPQASSPCVPWDNGEPDFLDAHLSQGQGPWGSISRVADDFVLEDGAFFKLDDVVLVMAVKVQDGVHPDAELEIYDDCDGEPGVLQTALPLTGKRSLGAAPWPEFTLYEFTFSFDSFVPGTGERAWISPVGLTDGYYYWITAGAGVIQGVQGQHHAPGCTPVREVWNDGEELVCAPICADYNFVIRGRCCDLLLDNHTLHGHDDEGLDSLATPANAPMAADDFQVPPREDVRVCKVVAWVATNCLPELSLFEIYDDECGLPTGGPIARVRDPQVIYLGTMSTDGLPVYELRWHVDDVILTAGRTYWLSVLGQQKGSIDDRFVWLFKNDKMCHIEANEAAWKNPFAGLLDFVPVSDPDVLGVRRDMAFQIWIDADAPELEPVTWLPGEALGLLEPMPRAGGPSPVTSEPGEGAEALIGDEQLGARPHSIWSR